MADQDQAKRNGKRNDRGRMVRSSCQLLGMSLGDEECKRVRSPPKPLPHDILHHKRRLIITGCWQLLQVRKSDFDTFLWRAMRRSKQASEMNPDFVKRQIRGSHSRGASEQWLWDDPGGDFYVPHCENGKFFLHTTFRECPMPPCLSACVCALSDRLGGHGSAPALL
jgi:hypothetical protein